ncbi:uncharacterized protein DUF1905 [Branchiibius hedensis]|uniref:DUF1905 domain-containing protein n=1 Tax=Branchiibius hedensis TaxID=672460 RepID=A0A2Y8ZRG3_9MICO|nr:uncharacterized protein DUF1905 [Branchiibius hedensis]SSA33928.1 protein of unknown function [Branchiibius hedensis]
MDVSFVGEVIEWRGPAPYLFVPVSDQAAEEVAQWARFSYGWGCIPVTATIGHTRWPTSLMPKDGQYLVPVRVAVQRTEGVGLGDTVRVRLDLRFER